MPYDVSIEDAKKRFPEYEFVAALTPSEQKAAFHVRDDGGQDLCLKLISPQYDIDRVKSGRARELIAGRWGGGITGSALGATPVRRELRTPPVNHRANVSSSVWFGSPDVTLNETSGEPRVH